MRKITKYIVLLGLPISSATHAMKPSKCRRIEESNVHDQSKVTDITNRLGCLGRDKVFDAIQDRSGTKSSSRNIVKHTISEIIQSRSMLHTTIDKCVPTNYTRAYSHYIIQLINMVRGHGGRLDLCDKTQRATTPLHKLMERNQHIAITLLREECFPMIRVDKPCNLPSVQNIDQLTDAHQNTIFHTYARYTTESLKDTLLHTTAIHAFDPFDLPHRVEASNMAENLLTGMSLKNADDNTPGDIAHNSLKAAVCLDYGHTIEGRNYTDLITTQGLKKHITNLPYEKIETPYQSFTYITLFKTTEAHGRRDLAKKLIREMPDRKRNEIFINSNGNSCIQIENDELADYVMQFLPRSLQSGQATHQEATRVQTEPTNTDTSHDVYSEPGTLLITCPICLEEYDPKNTSDTLQLPRCEHNFHYSCFQQWREYKSWCPLCRKPFQEQ